MRAVILVSVGSLEAGDFQQETVGIIECRDNAFHADSDIAQTLLEMEFQLPERGVDGYPDDHVYSQADGPDFLRALEHRYTGSYFRVRVEED